MTKARAAGGAFAIALALLAAAVAYRSAGGRAESAASNPPAIAAPTEVAPAEAAATARNGQGFLHGRIHTVDGATYEGRLRWGGGQEAFWGDYFNGAKLDNPWATRVPPERLRRERRPIEVFGMKVADREVPIDFDRPFMARFGDIARVETRGRDVRVTLKSGTAFDLDRLEASDFDDGVRVWDGARGAVDLDSLRIRAIELLPAPAPGDAPARLHGTVSTAQGDFTGFLQWNREQGVGTDELHGRTSDGEIGVRFDKIRAIARRSPGGVQVALRDGRDLVLSGGQQLGEGHRGVYVDDPRYGRVLVSWAAFERVDFDDAGRRDSGPGYDDFPPGRPLAGSVTTRDGRRLAGRLVYDLDESETTETLDAPARGVDYMVPFGRIVAILVPDPAAGAAARARLILAEGEELDLDVAGDLGPGNLGLLVFVEGRESPEYVPWSEVERIDLDGG